MTIPWPARLCERAPVGCLERGWIVVARALAVLALVIAVCAAHPAEAQPPVPPAARAHLDRGEQLFGAGGFDAALAEFEAAYEALAGHPSRYVTLFNIAQCHERAARYDEAQRAYQRYLDEGGARDADANEVRGRIRLLEGLLGTIQVTLRWPSGTGPNAELWVAGRRVGTAPGTVRLPGGTHALEVRARGYERVSEVITLTAGATRQVELAMRVLGTGLDPVVFWTTSAATAVALGLGAAFGVVALVRHGELSSIAPQALRTRADLAELSTFALVADVSFVAAGVLGTAALVLAFLTDFSGASAPATALVPYVTPTSAGLAFSTDLP